MRNANISIHQLSWCMELTNKWGVGGTTFTLGNSLLTSHITFFLTMKIEFVWHCIFRRLLILWWLVNWLIDLLNYFDWLKCDWLMYWLMHGLIGWLIDFSSCGTCRRWAPSLLSTTPPSFSRCRSISSTTSCSGSERVAAVRGSDVIHLFPPNWKVTSSIISRQI